MAFRFAVPLSFWGIHVLMDAIQIEYLGVASAVEIVFIALLFLALMWTEFRVFKMQHQCLENSARSFASWEVKRMTWILNSVNPISTNKTSGSSA
jgi:hypothetical protein